MNLQVGRNISPSGSNLGCWGLPSPWDQLTDDSSATCLPLEMAEPPYMLWHKWEQNLLSPAILSTAKPGWACQKKKIKVQKGARKRDKHKESKNHRTACLQSTDFWGCPGHLALEAWGLFSFYSFLLKMLYFNLKRGQCTWLPGFLAMVTQMTDGPPSKVRRSSPVVPPTQIISKHLILLFPAGKWSMWIRATMCWSLSLRVRGRGWH